VEDLARVRLNAGGAVGLEVQGQGLDVSRDLAASLCTCPEPQAAARFERQGKARPLALEVASIPRAPPMPGDVAGHRGRDRDRSARSTRPGVSSIGHGDAPSAMPGLSMR